MKCCGHKCKGTRGETACLPCLEPECREAESRLPDKEEMCTICYTSSLEDEPSVQLDCGHIFHANCVRRLLQHKWNTLKISFSFMDCPKCKRAIEASHCPPVNHELKKLNKLRSNIETKAVKAAKEEGLDKDPRLTTPGDFFYGKLREFALHNCSFYECAECSKPYFGGLVDCE